MPAVVDVFGRADHAEAVVGQLHVVAAGQEQVALAVLAHRVAGVDVGGQTQADGLAPGTVDGVGPDHEVVALVGRARREVDVVAALVLDQVRRPDRAHVGTDRMRQRLPVHQVARMPDRQARVGVERGQREVVILAVLEHGRIGVVAGQHRVEEAPIAQVGHALVLDAALPGLRGVGGQRRAGHHHAGGQHQQPPACRIKKPSVAGE